QDKDGWTPLHAAALKQHDGISGLLLDKLENGREVVAQMMRRLEDGRNRDLLDEMADKKSVGNSVVSGLRSAVNSGHGERVLALLAAGADIDAEDSVGGGTALTLATWLCREDLVHVLLENGADVNRPDRSGRTALQYAAVDGYHDLVELLVEHGAHLNAKIHGWTALLLAAKNWKESSKL
ncbi:ankyrin repeat-containing domain protein, partial [Staphylotrichum tortipilum]